MLTLADPVLLCNNLGVPAINTAEGKTIHSDGRSSTSLKEAVRVAQSNNFMGLVCSSRILNAVPALIEAITAAGLVLVSDASDEVGSQRSVGGPASANMLEGVAGLLRDDGVMLFTETIEV